METIRLIPLFGKYASVDYDGKTYEIWKVNPTDNQAGTPIAHAIAISLLKLTPQAVTVLPLIKDGKAVAQLSDTEVKAIADAHANAPSVLQNRVAADEPVKATDTSALSALITQQSKTLEEAMKTIQSQNEKITSLSETVSALQASASATATATDGATGKTTK